MFLPYFHAMWVPSEKGGATFFVEMLGRYPATEAKSEYHIFLVTQWGNVYPVKV